MKGGEKVRGVSIFSPNEKGQARKSARYRSERFRVRGASGVPREHAGAAPKGQATHSPGRRGSHKSGTASRKSRLTTDARLLRMREMIKERCVVCFRTRIGPEMGRAHLQKESTSTRSGKRSKERVTASFRSSGECGWCVQNFRLSGPRALLKRRRNRN